MRFQNVLFRSLTAGLGKTVACAARLHLLGLPLACVWLVMPGGAIQHGDVYDDYNHGKPSVSFARLQPQLYHRLRMPLI